MEQMAVAIAGLGSRGRDTYARYAEEQNKKIKITAVADLSDERRREAAETFGIPTGRCFKTAEEMLCADKLADVMFVCTPDEDHYNTAMGALKKGYHLLLEKPVAATASECVEIARTAKENARHVIVCHVLRYSPFYGRIKEIIDSGEIGEVVTVNAVENVGYYHQAHSFVRGKWADTKASSPMILAKSCHDMDILLWLAGKHVKSVSSYGGLYYFKPEKAPEGAEKRCLDGCKAKETCPYDAEKIYITNEATGIAHGHDAWPVDVLARPVTEENIRRALETGPYGRCVFHCGNDAVDHQVVNIEFDDGVTAHLTMTAFSPEISRTVEVKGTLGSVEGDMSANTVKLSVFGQKPREYNIAEATGGYGGHGGGDIRMFNALFDGISGGGDSALTSIENSVASHLVCFAAERSRLNGGAPETLG